MRKNNGKIATVISKIANAITMFIRTTYDGIVIAISKTTSTIAKFIRSAYTNTTSALSAGMHVVSTNFDLLKKWLQENRRILVAKVNEPDETDENHPPIHSIIIFGAIILVLFFGSLTLWSVFAPLESAAIADGKIIVASNRKTIQHLEGGIIKKIYVHEGSQVKKGQPLLVLEDTQAKSAFYLYHDLASDLLATEARLVAERDNQKTIQFPERLLKQKDETEVKKLMKAQQSIFENNKKTLTGQTEILNQRIEQLKKQIESYHAQVASNKEQLKFIKEELAAVEILDKKNLIEKPRKWALQREAARLVGNRDELIGAIAQSEQKIGETKQQMLTLKDTTQKETLKQLSDVRNKLASILEKEKASEDIFKRTTIVSPQTGIVVGLKEHTIGGIIMPGRPILDIVPKKDQLLVEARINPLDIDVVHPGMLARIQLVAYKRYKTPKLDGTVTYVSADSFQDEKTARSYYLARIKVSANDLKRLKHVSLYPGMPVKVLIIKEKRTLFDYFITPFKESFQGAFLED